MGDAAGRFAALAGIADAAGRQVLASARELQLPAGSVVFRQGDACGQYLLLVEGAVRVFARAASGREIVLYHIASGGTCVLTTSCLLGQQRYPAEGVAETAITALGLPAAAFEEGLARSADFRRFVFGSHGARLAVLIARVEEVAFERVELRVARWLREHADAQGRVVTTHQALATELGTAREVVTRQLQAMRRSGLLALRRGCIEIIDPDGLARLGQTELR